jgi:hypothetical protein
MRDIRDNNVIINIVMLTINLTSLLPQICTESR